MAATLLKIGPFVGGLNNISDPTSIKDTELAVCKNFDFDLDGTLISRPPIVADTAAGPVAGQNIDIIGTYVTTAGASYIIGSTDSQIWQKASGVWTSIATGFRASAAIQYLDKMWIVSEPGSGVTGGSWDPGAGFTNVATMPKGQAITVFKDRLWIAAGPKETTNTSRAYFSAIADGTTWNGADFLDVSKGDGDKLIDLIAISSNLYLFKGNSTHVFQYDSAPSKGVVTRISNTIGVADVKCIVQYESTLYVYHNDYLYELYNYNHTKVNVRLSISNNASGAYFRPITVSLIGVRVVVSFYNNIFVFYTLTRTWSQWVTFTTGRWYAIPTTPTDNNPNQYICGSNSVNAAVTYSFTDGTVAGRSEPFNCRLETKIYDFNAPNLFKKLSWWGVDCFAIGTVDSYAVPVIYTSNITWAQMSAFTWAQASINTWGQPLTADVRIHETLVVSGIGRKFLKFLKSARFRNLYFIVDFTITDWLNTTRVYSITPTVAMKQQVSKAVN
jgi:hypothetical protein